MPKTEIPMRPKGRRFKLTEKEMNCLTWYVLSGCKREDAYLIFVRPDLAVSKPNLRTISSQFFSAMEVRDYIEAYRETLDGVQQESEHKEEDFDKKVTTAVQKFTDKVVDKMSGDLESVEEMDAVAKLADRVGVLDDKSEVEIKPIRVLPALCKTECRYRAFVEAGKANGTIFDECDFCTARKFAEERGFKYDPCMLLDIPKEVVEELDKKNNVRLEDIVNGKVDN